MSAKTLQMALSKVKRSVLKKGTERRRILKNSISIPFPFHPLHFIHSVPTIQFHPFHPLKSLEWNEMERMEWESWNGTVGTERNRTDGMGMELNGWNGMNGMERNGWMEWEWN
ncbi:hypothetical protein BpHYR1_034294 [Brachionus plicatilis]|uniref:Uncharacterized protein n=1 Tax=Brachionus plicatilis TaxID=10195 RepID=A0A3M7RVE9_BRAPC|nr:hypothetical protein BpHYR1_034294 [Brachionus plicatilis]